MYAVGDVTSVGTPKAGVFAEGQAAIVADAIVARHRGVGLGAREDDPWRELGGGPDRGEVVAGDDDGREWPR